MIRVAPQAFRATHEIAARAALGIAGARYEPADGDTTGLMIAAVRSQSCKLNPVGASHTGEVSEEQPQPRQLLRVAVRAERPLRSQPSAPLPT